MRPRTAKFALLPIGIGVGVAAEWASYDSSVGAALTGMDFAVGCLLIGCGVIAWSRRPESRVGALMNLAGFTWFLGTVFELALYLHRGPLVHLHLSYPTGRLRTRLTAAVVAAAYVDALVEPLAANGVVTLVLSAFVALTALGTFLGSSGPARKAGGPALAAALAFAAALALGAVNRLTGSPSEHAVLWIYDVVIASVAIVLTVDLLRGRWSEAVVTGLVVDLGSPAQAGTLRAKLARALGDPSLVVAYRVPGTPDFVDDAGEPAELPRAGSGRTITPLVDHGEQVAVLVHDEALMADPQLVDSVAAAARIAVVNAALQADARAQAAELEESRRRIVEAGDAQRRRLEQELRLGAGQRLEEVAVLLAGARTAAAQGDAQAIEALERELSGTRVELEDFARGMHLAALTEHGVTAAVKQLAERSPLPVAVRGDVDGIPADVEAALFFVCSEGVTNAVKHARATRITIDLRADPGLATVVVADDGVGGATTDDGTGLLGLADRIGAVGGRFRLESPPGAGTRLTAEIGYDVKIPASRRTGQEARPGVQERS
jgi:signal transduction histidine kinase